MSSKIFNILILVVLITLGGFSALRFTNVTNSLIQNRIVIFDSGQGDSALIQFENINILIDVGPKDFDIASKLDKYIPIENRKIDLLIITHPHLDHYGGLLRLSKTYRINEIIVEEYCNVSVTAYAPMIGKQLLEVKNGTEMYLDELTLVFLRNELNNSNEECEQSYDGNFNNDSLVTVIKYANQQYIFWGDLEEPFVDSFEKKFPMYGIESNFALWKAGHHCSKTSTNEGTFTDMNTDLVVCSVGKNNKYNHPSAQVLDNFKENNIKYLITYETGDIVIPMIE